MNKPANTIVFFMGESGFSPNFMHKKLGQIYQTMGYNVIFIDYNELSPQIIIDKILSIDIESIFFFLFPQFDGGRFTV